jgi:hypothetical protein
MNERQERCPLTIPNVCWSKDTNPTSIQHSKFYTARLVHSNVTVFYRTSKESWYVLTVSSLTVVCPLHGLDHRTVTEQKMESLWKEIFGVHFGIGFLSFREVTHRKYKNLQQGHRLSGPTIERETWRMRNRTNHSNLSIQVSVILGGDSDLLGIFFATFGDHSGSLVILLARIKTEQWTRNVRNQKPSTHRHIP